MTANRGLFILTIRRDAAGEYRWNLMRRGHVRADSGEGYTRSADAVRAALALPLDWSRVLVACDPKHHAKFAALGAV